MGTRRFVVGLGVTLCLHGAACSEHVPTPRSPEHAAAPKHGAPPNATHGESTSTLPGPAPSVDPPSGASERAILALAAGVDGCTFDDVHGFTAECDGLERWEAESELFLDGRGDATLVWLLEHGSAKGRALAAAKLVSEGSSFADDPSLAKRVIATAAGETNEAVGAELGHAVASIDLAATSSELVVLKLLERPRNVALTVGLLEELTTHNESTNAIDTAIAHATADERAEIRQAAVLGLALSPERVACPRWERALGDADPSVALAAAHLVASQKRCEALVDPTLAFLGAAQRRGLLRETVAASTLAELCELDAVTPAERTLAAGLAEGFASPELPVGLREEALRAALACSSDERKFVKRFTSDKDQWLRRMAKDLLKERHTKHASRHR